MSMNTKFLLVFFLYVDRHPYRSRCSTIRRFMRRSSVCLFHLLSRPIYSSFRYIFSASFCPRPIAMPPTLNLSSLRPVYRPLQRSSRWSSSTNLSLSSPPHPFYLLSSCRRILTGHVSLVLGTTTAFIKTSRSAPCSCSTWPQAFHSGGGGGVDLV